MNKKVILSLSSCLIFLLLTGCGLLNRSNKDLEELINVYTRDASSGTREAFEVKVGFKGDLTNQAFEVSSNGDMATKISRDPNSIGYVSLATNFSEGGIKPLKYDGFYASPETVISNDYDLTRNFSFVTRKSGDFSSRDKEDLLKAFVDYILNSKEGRQVILAYGGIVDVDTGVYWDQLKENHEIILKDNKDITIYTGGSTSVEKTLRAALESFIPLAGDFEINMNHTGSGDGYKRTLGSEKDGANKIDIGFFSRELKEEEDVGDTFLKGVYCKDAIVVVVNGNNAEIENLTKENLGKIFKGEIKTFKELK